MCYDTGNLFCLFDAVFSILNSKRDSFDQEKIKKFVEHVSQAFKKWKQMDLTVTHKSHLLLAHAVTMLRLRKGFTHVGESRLERAHQTQSKDRDSSKRTSDPEKANLFKMREQAIRNDVHIQKVSNNFKEASKRKRKGMPIEYKIKSNNTKEMRQVKRERMLEEVKNEETNFVCKDHTQVKIEQKELEMRTEHENSDVKNDATAI